MKLRKCVTFTNTSFSIGLPSDTGNHHHHRHRLGATNFPGNVFYAQGKIRGHIYTSLSHKIIYTQLSTVLFLDTCLAYEPK